jgi:hypothetical protein
METVATYLQKGFVESSSSPLQAVEQRIPKAAMLWRDEHCETTIAMTLL